MSLLKQIKFGSVSTPIAMTQVAINDDSKKVLSVVPTHTELSDANDPVYTIALAVDGQTILKGNTGLETALALQVKAAVDGENPKKARIAMVDKAGAERSFVNIEDIVGNGVITATAYEPTTGQLTITWAGGTTTTVDLGKLLDIDDVAIESASQNYLKVELDPAAGETGGSQAVFGAKIVKVSEATDAKTGLVDAKDVKEYVDGAIAIEVARADAKVLAAIKALDATVKDGLDSADDTQVAEGKHVGVKVVETDGVLTSISVVEKDIASKAALDAEIKARGDADTKLAQDLAAEVNRAKSAETAIDSVVGLTKAENSETRTFTPTANYGGESTTVMANMQAIDTKLKEVEGTLAGVQYKVNGTTLEFFGITEKKA